jgi:hypothetical protein
MNIVDRCKRQRMNTQVMCLSCRLLNSTMGYKRFACLDSHTVLKKLLDCDAAWQ